ncbi:hypothetical protein [Nannocystis pusilla]|uniref:Lipoprotein n=1 Tax=Nannocystis pusilla TaxID=889268 RepID=A0ABS7TTZ3_9BACT|nr:hypothetical protein [Nannocystis pusilla]MBZ5711640.1 hypothetical protein [Nannocystis pusilla]
MSCALIIAAAGCDPGEDAAPVAAEEIGAESELLVELDLPNGNVLRFFAVPGGGVVAEEEGHALTNSLASLPELMDASPYEVFRAVAPRDRAAPAELLEDYEETLAERASTGAAGTPEDFHVDQLAGFYEFPQARKFSDCTDVSAWQDYGEETEIGANCPGSAGTSYYQCLSNWSPPLSSNCGGFACTEFFTNQKKFRASACARTGDTYVTFMMAGKLPADPDYTLLFNRTLADAGTYYNYWYSYGTARHFYRLIYRWGTGTRNINKSLWFKS